ncbi:hypothetical protein A2U01_0085116, partial [Trifolium medium]|nr:hypothetical protein [Trifolium medium]
MQYEEVEVADAIHHARPEDNNPARESHRKGGDRKKNDKHREPEDHPACSRATLPLPPRASTS